MLSVRAKVDSKGHDKVYAYGKALLYVARLISNACDVSAERALIARDLMSEELDRVYRDLFSSTRRCRSFLAEGHSESEMADNLAAACSILKNLYRMRFHSQRASSCQMTEAGDLADRLMTLVQALSELGNGAVYRNDASPMRMAA